MMILLCPLQALAQEMPATTAPYSINSFENMLLHGTTTLDVRYRYEGVDQDGLKNDARASTLRTRIGYITGTFHDFKAGMELQDVTAIGPQNFNNTYNGKTTYPVVADPSDANINQLYISYSGLMPKTTVTAGRQLINLDDQRFVGASEWRQHDQTFDAVSFSSQYLNHTSFYYAYISHVNRIYGVDAPSVPAATAGEYGSQSHLINGSYELDPALKATGFAYLLDFRNASTMSNATYGLRLTGKYAVTSNTSLIYAGSVAHQTDYADNPSSISENYSLLEPGISWNGWTGKGGYEALQGNDATAFQTPLATFHSFDGWADKFTSTPPNGLKNRYGSLAYKIPFGNQWLKGAEGTVVFRRFDSTVNDIHYGNEVDSSLTQAFFKHYTLGLEFADYKAHPMTGNTTTNTTKGMFWLTVKY